jgi:hypothetical protein
LDEKYTETQEVLARRELQEKKSLWMDKKGFNANSNSHGNIQT